jgi:hypothetical protein
VGKEFKAAPTWKKILMAIFIGVVGFFGLAAGIGAVVMYMIGLVMSVFVGGACGGLLGAALAGNASPFVAWPITIIFSLAGISTALLLFFVVLGGNLKNDD